SPHGTVAREPVSVFEPCARSIARAIAAAASGTPAGSHRMRRPIRAMLARVTLRARGRGVGHCPPRHDPVHPDVVTPRARVGVVVARPVLDDLCEAVVLLSEALDGSVGEEAQPLTVDVCRS